MVQGKYIYWKNVFSDEEALTGIDNKVKDQITLFNKYGLNCELIVAPHGIYVNRLTALFPYLRDDRISWPDISELEGADYMYMRRPDFVSHEYIHWLKEVRSAYPKIKIIYEIPTYPYDGEWVGFRDFNYRIKDIWNRRKLKNYIDIIADLSGSEEIFGIPVIPMSNGVNVDSTSMRNPDRGQIRGRADILCVAYYSKWHGIDRFIKGLYAYYKTNVNVEVFLHLVGGGDRRCLKALRRMTKRYHLQDHVLFHGPVPRERLDKYYNECDFAIESLGVHRRKIARYSYSIKSREYIAKGMPFVYSTPIDLERFASIPFCFKSTEDEKPVDISTLIDFYLNLYNKMSEREVAEKLRDFGAKWVSLDFAMEKIINYIKNI